METYRVSLRPTGHIATLPTSETLFGALCWAMRDLFGVDALLHALEQFAAGQAPFVISSAFPSLQGSGETVDLLPPPRGLRVLRSQVEHLAQSRDAGLVPVFDHAKRLRQARYVSRAIMRRVLAGVAPQELLVETWQTREGAPDDEHAVLRGETILAGAEFNSLSDDCRAGLTAGLVSERSMLRASIDRLSDSTTPGGQLFYSRRLTVDPQATLTAWLRTEDVTPVRAAFSYLQDGGIGGQRSIGQGRYEISVETADALPGADSGEAFVSLSRYLPADGEVEMTSELLAYDMLPYRGRVESAHEFHGEDIFKRQVLYWAEGAVVPVTEQKPVYGSVPVVKEIGEQRIYQNGLAFPLFFASEAGESDAA